MKKKITFKGTSMSLVGRDLKVGSKAPDFRVVSQEMKEVTLNDFKDKVKLIITFPSLDTPVCDLQVKEFNKRATSLSDEVAVIGISMDLPFAQKRFCQINDIKNAIVLSDYKFASFGKNYGLLVKELHLLARAVLILDKQNRLRYLQIVEELTDSPKYDEAIEKIAEVLRKT